MSKNKVLITFDSMKYTNCGYFSFGYGLSKALIKQNNEKNDLTFYLFKESRVLFDVFVNVINLSILDRLFFKNKNNFDVVHFSDQTCRLSPKRVNSKKIMTIHDMNKVHLKYSNPHRIKVYLKNLGKLISACDRVVCISNFVAKDVKHYFPDQKDKVSVIYNGADKLIPKSHHIPKYKPNKPFLFTIGLLSAQKGFHLLPALLEGNDYIMVISGRETSHKEVILAEAIKYNCLDRVIITGIINDDDKTWYYENCKAFLFPSIAEGFGLPVIEAMYFGKPVFLSKFTSLPEVGGKVAYYFDDFDAKKMQLVFKNGLQDYELNNRKADILLQAQKFTWEISADKYLDLYDECLNSK